MSRTMLAALMLLVATAGAADAEQLRLRTGDLLQGEVVGEQSDEEILTFRLYRTGGVFTLQWEHLIPEDEERLRDELGLTLFDETAVPLLPGSQLTLVNATVVRGVIENPNATSGPIFLRTSTGTRQYGRDMVMKIVATMVEALDVYTPDELYDIYLREGEPESPSAHMEFADRLLQIRAYAQADKHYRLALEDPNFAESDRAPMVQNRLKRVALLLEAADATARETRVRRLQFQKKFDLALAELETLRAELEEKPMIRDLLNLDRLERQVRSSRRKFFLRDVRTRFLKEMQRLISAKVREEELSINEVVQWAQTPRDLTKEIFDRIAEETGLSPEEAMEFWEGRTNRQVRRYNYGGGTFIHPEVRDRVTKTAAARNAGARNRGGGGRNAGRNAANRGGEQPKTAQEWWEKFSSTKARENFVRAWYVEFGEQLSVLRFDTTVCRSCGGKGQSIMKDVEGNEIVDICDVCNLAGHERIVIAR
jgi:hypothetical protein